MKKVSYFFSHLLDIAPHEWGAVSYSFFSKFFIATGHILGHTILLSIFVSELGVARLPFFFILLALFTMLGTMFFSRLRESRSKESLIPSLALVTAGVLVLARTLVEVNIYLFFLVAVFAYSVVLTQMMILIGLRIEGLFTPLEAKRTFPVIESSELWGALVGGFLAVFFTAEHAVIHISTADLIFVWAGIMLLPILVNWIYLASRRWIPVIHSEEKKEVKSNLAESWKVFKMLRHDNFLKYLGLAVLLTLAAFQLLEFQYTKALAQTFGEDESLTHGLGTYIMIFSAAGILADIFLAGRIMRTFGILRTQILQPLVTLIPVSVMAVSFSFPTAVSARFSFELFDAIGRNAYNASFYALRERIREMMKPFMEGWIKPAGAIFGTLILFAAEYWISDESSLTMVISIILIFITLLVALFYILDQKYYTELAVKGLRSGDLLEKYTAIEIMSEKGHKGNIEHLSKSLKLHHRDPEVREKILSTLGEVGDERAIAVFLDHFEDEHLSVKHAAISSLNKFRRIGRQFFTQSFARYRVARALEDLFQREKSRRLKSEIIKAFAKMESRSVAPFLLNLLKNDDLSVVEDAIVAIASFHDNNIIYYLRPFLEHHSPRIRAAAITALWQFPTMRIELIAPQIKLLSSADKEAQKAALHMLGEIRAKHESKKIYSFLGAADEELRREASIALGKIGDEISILYLLDLLLDEDTEVSEMVSEQLHHFPTKFCNKLKKIMNHEISRRISNILRSVASVRDLSDEKFAQLLRFYRLIGEHKEAVRLRNHRK